MNETLEKTVVLDSELGTSSAEELLSTLRSERGKPVAIDASQVELLGGFCFQILASAARSWKADGNGFRIVAPSAAFASYFKMFGAEPEEFGLEEVAQ